MQEDELRVGKTGGAKIMRFSAYFRTLMAERMKTAPSPFLLKNSVASSRKIPLRNLPTHYLH